jgi:hypothetical protein
VKRKPRKHEQNRPAKRPESVDVTGSEIAQPRIAIAGHSVNVIDVLMVASALGWLLFVLARAWHSEMIASDDAFISFRYAKNLADGHGLVFNVGERVWGFTSPLQTLVLALLTRVGMDTVWAAFSTGFLWAAVTAVFLYFLGIRVLPRILALCLASAFLLDCSLHGSYALESGFLVAMQTAFLLAITERRTRLACILAGLSCLVRPDSILLVLPILLVDRDARHFRNIFGFLLPGLLWEAFAIAYFGQVVPNSYHAKSGLTEFVPFFLNGFKYLTGVSLAPNLGLAATPSNLGRAVLVIASLLPLFQSKVRKQFPLVYAFVVFPWILLIAYSTIGSFPGHNWEFYSARLFLIASACIGILGTGHAVIERIKPRTGYRWAVAAAVFAFVIVNGGSRTIATAAGFAARDHSYWSGARHDTYRHIANWVNASIPPGSTFAISEVGTFGYYANVKIIDVSGIVTRGYLPEERMQHARFMRRFGPSYALVYGDRQEMRVAPDLRYQRIYYFPKFGFEDFSLMALDPPRRTASANDR